MLIGCYDLLYKNQWCRCCRVNKLCWWVSIRHHVPFEKWLPQEMKIHHREFRAFLNWYVCVYTHTHLWKDASPNLTHLNDCGGSGSEAKNPLANAGDTGSILGLGESPGEAVGNPLQYSCLGIPMDREAWRATVHAVGKSQTWLSN